MKKIQLFCFFCSFLGLTNMQAQDAQPNIEAQQKLEKVNKQFFIENKGQWPREVLYLTQSAGLNTWITTKGMWYEFFKTEEAANSSPFGGGREGAFSHFEPKETKRWGHRVGYTLIGNNKTVITEAKQKQEGYYNYLIGNDPSKHASYVGLYKEAIVKEVYKGIDMRYYFDKGTLRYDYVVKPGADPRQIQFKFEGADNSYLNEKGELVFTTCFGEVKNADLYTYQEENKLQVKSKFIKTSEGFSFDLGNYNKSQTLIIDPLIYSTYIGGSGSSQAGYCMTLDVTGNAFVTGYANSANYNITPGAFQTTNGGMSDAFVTKLNSMGTALIYSTFIGGATDDIGSSIIIDVSGNSFICGRTNSPNYPTTLGVFQTNLVGSDDVFVTKLNSTGSALIFSTLIGGNNSDGGRDIAIDGSGNAYFTGFTASSDFPVTQGVLQIQNGGLGNDAFVTKINATGTTLIYSTYIGGSSVEICHSIALDALGNAYITGDTYSADFNIIPGGFQTLSGGGGDVFVSKVNSTGTALIYSTYIGGNNVDIGNDITIDNNGNAYITGYSSSVDFDVTPGALQTIKGGSEDIFVCKLNDSGTALIYSTYIGGNANERGHSLILDVSHNAYITGNTNSSSYPTTLDAFQTSLQGSDDVFVTKLNSTGTALLYSTYCGGSGVDYSFCIALDAAGSVYITGSTGSIDFDTTFGAFHTTKTGSGDVFVTKFGQLGSTAVSEITKADLFNISPNPSQGIYQIDFGNSANGFIQLEVLDMQGNLIEKQNLSNKNSTSIDLSKYASGVYILKVIANNKQEIARLVKL